MRKLENYQIKEIPVEKQTETITVVVPIYNVAGYLEKCIESILTQTYQNLEIILVDDCSTDASPAICDKYAAIDSRIKVLHKETNEGLGYARNSGMKMATGTYLTFVDSDDWIDENMYEMMLSALLDTGSELAVCRYKSVYSDRVEDSSTGVVTIFQGTELLEEYIRRPYEPMKISNAVWNKLYKRALAQELFFPSGIFEDILFTTRLLLQATRSVYMDAAFYNYLSDRPQSIMNSENFVHFVYAEEENARKKSLLLKQNGKKELADIVDIRFYTQLSHYYLDAGKKNLSPSELRLLRDELNEWIRSSEQAIRSIYWPPKVTFKEFVRMRLFLISPQVFLLFSQIKNFLKLKLKG